VSHLGSRVSALLDGRLPAEEEERLWAHVHTCHPCRDLVEREGWVKTRLAGLSLDPGAAPAGLKDSLLCPTSGPALRPGAFPAARHRHRGLALIGGGAAGAAVVGVLALGAASTPQLERRPPASDLNRPVTTSSVSPQARPSRHPRGQASTRTPAPSRASRDATGSAGRTSGAPRAVRHLLDGVAARGTMTP
jgi:anti-sigma factor RsiW